MSDSTDRVVDYQRMAQYQRLFKSSIDRLRLPIEWSAEDTQYEQVGVNGTCRVSQRRYPIIGLCSIMLRLGERTWASSSVG